MITSLVILAAALMVAVILLCVALSRQLPLNHIYAPIPYTVIRDGLQAALNKLEGEMSEMEKELKEWIS